MEKFGNCNMETFDMRQALQKFWDYPEGIHVSDIPDWILEELTRLETIAFKAGWNAAVECMTNRKDD